MKKNEILSSENLNRAFEGLKEKGIITRDYEVSDKLSTSRSALSEYLNGKKTPSLKFLKKFGDEYGIRIEFLLNGDEPMFLNEEEKRIILNEQIPAYDTTKVIELQDKVIRLQEYNTKLIKLLMDKGIEVPEM